MKLISLIRRLLILVLPVLLLCACTTVNEVEFFTDATEDQIATIKPYSEIEKLSLTTYFSARINSVNGRNVPKNWIKEASDFIKVDPGVTILVAEVTQRSYQVTYWHTIPMIVELQPGASYEIRVRSTSRTIKGSRVLGYETWLVEMPSKRKASPSFYSKGLQ